MCARCQYALYFLFNNLSHFSKYWDSESITRCTCIQKSHFCNCVLCQLKRLACKGMWFVQVDLTWVWIMILLWKSLHPKSYSQKRALLSIKCKAQIWGIKYRLIVWKFWKIGAFNIHFMSVSLLPCLCSELEVQILWNFLGMCILQQAIFLLPLQFKIKSKCYQVKSLLLVKYHTGHGNDTDFVKRLRSGSVLSFIPGIWLILILSILFFSFLHFFILVLLISVLISVFSPVHHDILVPVYQCMKSSTSNISQWCHVLFFSFFISTIFHRHQEFHMPCIALIQQSRFCHEWPHFDQWSKVFQDKQPVIWMPAMLHGLWVLWK